MFLQLRKKTGFSWNAFIFCASFLFISCLLFTPFNKVQAAQSIATYQKGPLGTLTHLDWNGLLVDFVNTWMPANMLGPLGIGTTIPAVDTLSVVGNISGSQSLKISNSSAANWIAGNFGVGNTTAGASKFSIFGNQSIGTGYLNYAAPANGLIVEGNVGIGTSVPGAKLAVSGSIYAGLSNQIQLNAVDNGSLYYHAADGTSFTIGTKTYANPLIFAINSIERMRISSLGNVGIGTTTPTSTLHVAGNILTTGLSFSASSTDIKTSWADIVSAGGGDQWASNGADIYNKNYATGRVGIGTTLPGSKLTTQGTIQVTGVTTPISGNGVELMFQGGAGVIQSYNRNSGGNFTPLRLNAQVLDFKVSDATKMYIDAAGSVGIGTTNPGAKLTVAGGNLLLDNAAQIQFGDNTTRVTGHGINDTLGFITSNTERLSITASGNVGIGTTNPIHKLQVTGNTYVNAGTLFIDSANSLNWGDSQQGILGQNTIGLIFRTGNTERMRATHSGNIGIGTTSPSSTLAISGGTGAVLNVHGGHIRGLNSVPLDRDYAVPLGYIQDNYGAPGSSSSSSWLLNGNTLGSKKTIGSIDNQDLGIITNNLERLTVLKGGNVGIGIVDPRTRVDIVGASPKLRLANNVNNAGEVGVEFSHSTYTGLSEVKSAIVTKPTLGYGRADMYFILDSAADSAGYVSDNVDTKMIIRNNGFVGIGTTNPAGKLDVSAGLASQTAGDLVVDTANTTVYLGKLDSNSGNTTFIFRDRLGNQKSKWFNAGAGSIFFGNMISPGYGIKIQASNVTGISASATTSAKLEVDSENSAFPSAVFMSGNVGIGTTSPSSTLAISGGTGAVLNVHGGHIRGLNSVPLDRDYAVPLGYIQDNYGAPGSSSSSSWLLNGNTLGSKKTIGSIDNQDLGIITNNTDRITVLKDGKVGIGTTNPGARLDVSGASYLRTVALDSIFGYSGNNIAFTNAGNTTFVGNVGIGTSSPITKLHVYSGGEAQMMLQNTNYSSGPQGGLLVAQRNDGGLNIDKYGQANLLDIDGNGNVGIGTTSPSQKLDVNGNIKINSSNLANGGLYINANWDAGKEYTRLTGSALTFLNTAVIKSSSNSQGVILGSSGVGTDLRLFTNNIDRFTIISSGNVGIGTTTPANTLAISGGTGAVLNVHGGHIIGLNSVPLERNYAVPLGYLQDNYGVPGSSSSSSWLLNGNTLGSKKTIGSIDNQDLGIITNNLERLTVLKDGKVGIGTTAPGSKLTTQGTIQVTGVTTPISGNGVELMFQGGAGVIQSYNRDSGGNFTPLRLNAQVLDFKVSDATKMYIDAAGNVGIGIGTTSPLATLHVDTISSASTRLAYFRRAGANAGIGSNYLEIGQVGYDGLLVGENGGGSGPFLFGTYNEAFLVNKQTTATPSYAGMSFGTNNTVRMRIDSTGNVGIGTTAPTEILDVNGYAKASAFVSTSFAHRSYLGSSFWNPGATSQLSSYNTLTISTNQSGQNILIMPNAGNVGIGTTSPAVKLDFATATGDVINVRGGHIRGLNSVPLDRDYAVPLGYIQDNYNASSTNFWGGSLSGNIWSNNSGNIGIGTSSPSQKLEVSGGNVRISNNISSNTDAPLMVQNTASFGSGGVYNQYSQKWLNAAGTSFIASVRNDGQVYASASFSAPLFNSPQYGSTGMRMVGEKEIRFEEAGSPSVTIKNGSVGIGTTAPTRTLTVTGDNKNVLFRDESNYLLGEVGDVLRLSIDQQQDGTFPATPSVRQSFSVRWQSGTEAVIASIDARPSAGWGGGFVFSSKNADGSASGPLYERMVINHLGNVGIGTTAPAVKLDFATATGDVINVRGGHVRGLNSVPLDRDYAVPLGYIQDNYNASSTNFWGGSLSGNIWSNNSGNIGIGTTTPAATLEVKRDLATGVAAIINQQQGTGNILDLQFGGSSKAVFDKFGVLLSDAGIRSSNQNLRLTPASAGLTINKVSGAGNIALFQYNDVTKVVVDYLGNVGIGTTTPVTTLDVIGTANISSSTSIGASLTVLGQGIFSMGSQAVPAIRFGNTGNGNGFYSSSGGGGAVAVAINGNMTMLALTNSAGINQTKVAANTKLGWSSTPDNALASMDTGFTRGSANKIYVGNGTTGDFSGTFIAGSIGIGTTSPSSALAISGGTGTVLNVHGGHIRGLNSVPLDRDYAVPLGYIQDNYNASSTNFWGGSLSGNIWSNNSGNVGIGTTSPTQKLDVAGAVRIGSFPSSVVNSSEAFSGRASDETLGSYTIQLGGSSAVNTAFRVVDRAWTKTIMSISGEAPAASFRVASSGSVGIGTSTPSQKLHVIGNIIAGQNDQTRIQINANGGIAEYYASETTPRWRIFRDLIGSRPGLMFNDGVNSSAVAAPSNAMISLYTGGTERLRVDNVGNVGVGVTNPVAKLDVAGSVRIIGSSPSYFASSTSSSLEQSIRFFSDRMAYTWGGGIKTYFDNQGMWIGDYGGGTGVNANIIDAYVRASLSGTASNYRELYFRTGGLDRLKITETGNVGIGTTSPSSTLAISGGTGTVLNVHGGHIRGLNSVPLDRDYAVPLGYIQDNYNASSTNFWGGSLSGNIWSNNSSNVGIGTTNPRAKLELGGGLIMKTSFVNNTNYTAQADDYIIAYSNISADRTVTLPNSLCIPGRFFVIMDQSGSVNSSAKIIIDPEGDVTKIVGQSTFMLASPYNAVYVFCGNNAWFLL